MRAIGYLYFINRPVFRDTSVRHCKNRTSDCPEEVYISERGFLLRNTGRILRKMVIENHRIRGYRWLNRS